MKQPWRFLVLEGFFIFILLGTLLLSLPISSNGSRLTLLEAFFTATSATCVTGLSVFDIGTRLSLFGQGVLLVLVQFGALGITAFSTFLLVLAGRRLSMKSEFALMDAYGSKKVKGMRSLLCWTFSLTLAFEAIGAIFFYWRNTHPLAGTPAMSRASAAWNALFHSVSGFCNAGFSLYTDSLEGMVADPVWLLGMAFLILTGSLGFIVLYNLFTIKWWRRDLRKRGKLSLHTKIVLSSTAALVLLAFVFTLALEWNNTLAGMPFAQKLWCAFLHAVSPRTAGFTVLPTCALRDGTRLATEFMMFVGGSPASVSGGLKTTTLVILAMTVWAMCRNRAETVIFARTVPNIVVREAIAICLLLSAVTGCAYFALVCLQGGSGAASPELFFETVSATATSGLTMDLTPRLNSASQIMLIFCMILGRLGPLAVALAVGGKEEPQRIHYPEEDVVVG